MCIYIYVERERETYFINIYTTIHLNIYTLFTCVYIDMCVYIYIHTHMKFSFFGFGD